MSRRRSLSISFPPSPLLSIPPTGATSWVSPVEPPVVTDISSSRVTHSTSDVGQEGQGTEGRGRRRRYRLMEKEELGGKQLHVLEEGGSKVIWSMRGPRLTETEIVQTVFDSTDRARYTIHRPLEGWYIILRRSPSSLSPSEPPSSKKDEFTELLTRKGSKTSELRFKVATRIQKGESKFRNVDLEEMVVPPSPNFRVEFGGEVDSKGVVGCRLRRREKEGFGGVMRRFMGVQDKSFDCDVVTGLEGIGIETEILSFSDQSSVMGLSTTGILSLNQDLVDYLGLEPSFLISIVCGFLGFLEDGEAYDAARS